MCGMRWEKLRLRPDTPEIGATGGSGYNPNISSSEYQIIEF